ncbi:MAG: AAA family ATPase [Anaerolineales bacterium]|nr:AAA family ATPase [Anaerolineales bacterium]
MKHRQYEHNAEHLPDSIRRKAMWAQVLLGTRGRTPNVKTTTGYNARWRRTPVQGYHYYLWWIPLAESELAERSGAGPPGQTILVHSIRHHDETDDPIDLASLDEFEEVPLASLDPRFDEQRSVGRHLESDQIAPATVKGLPGSGKTVALFYLVRDLVLQSGIDSLLYVTYPRLKRHAQFLSAQAPELEQRIHIRTLTELEKEITGLPAHIDPMHELADFRRFLDMQPAASLGIWRRYPAALYTEIRAHLLGRTFPTAYTLPAPRLAEATFTEGAFNLDAYATSRRLTRDEAAIVVRLAERLSSDRFFLDQIAAGRALKLLTQPSQPPNGARKLPGWLRAIDALVVDEVQDLTLLQIALLAELARTRIHAAGRRLAVVVAGDESQIVQPSGFDWGVTRICCARCLAPTPRSSSSATNAAHHATWPM